MFLLQHISMIFEKHRRSVSRAASQWISILIKSRQIFDNRLLLVRCFLEFVSLFHTPVKKHAPLTTRSSSLRCVSAAEHHATLLNELQYGQDKIQKASHQEQSIIKYLPGLYQDTNPLRSCSRNRMTMLLKKHL